MTTTTCRYQTGNQLAADPDVIVCEVHGPQPAESQPTDHCYAPVTRGVYTGDGEQVRVVPGRCHRALVRRVDAEPPICTSPLPCGGHHHNAVATQPLGYAPGYICLICAVTVTAC